MFPFETCERVHKVTTHSLKCQSGAEKVTERNKWRKKKKPLQNKEHINKINPNHFKKKIIQTRPQNKMYGNYKYNNLIIEKFFLL